MSLVVGNVYNMILLLMNLVHLNVLFRKSKLYSSYSLNTNCFKCILIPNKIAIPVDIVKLRETYRMSNH